MTGRLLFYAGPNGDPIGYAVGTPVQDTGNTVDGVPETPDLTAQLLYLPPDSAVAGPAWTLPNIGTAASHDLAGNAAASPNDTQSFVWTPLAPANPAVAWSSYGGDLDANVWSFIFSFGNAAHAADASFTFGVPSPPGFTLDCNFMVAHSSFPSYGTGDWILAQIDTRTDGAYETWWSATDNDPLGQTPGASPLTTDSNSTYVHVVDLGAMTYEIFRNGVLWYDEPIVSPVSPTIAATWNTGAPPSFMACYIHDDAETGTNGGPGGGTFGDGIKGVAMKRGRLSFAQMSYWHQYLQNPLGTITPVGGGPVAAVNSRIEYFAMDGTSLGTFLPFGWKPFTPCAPRTVVHDVMDYTVGSGTPVQIVTTITADGRAGLRTVNLAGVDVTVQEQYLRPFVKIADGDSSAIEPSLRGSVGFNGGPATFVDVVLPASQPGDRIVIFAATTGNGTGVSATGFGSIDRVTVTSSGDFHNLDVLEKTAVSTDSGATVRLSLSSNQYLWGVAAVVKDTDGFDATATFQSGGYSLDREIASVVTGEDDSFLVAAATTFSVPTFDTAPSGWTVDVTHPYARLYSKSAPAAGATGVTAFDSASVYDLTLSAVVSFTPKTAVTLGGTSSVAMNPAGTRMTLTNVAGQDFTINLCNVLAGCDFGPAPELPVARGDSTTLQGGIAQNVPLGANDNPGTTPSVWSYVSGTLPPGMSLASNGNLNGTPSQAGTFTFRYRILDNRGEMSFADVTINVSPVVVPPSGPSATDDLNITEFTVGVQHLYYVGWNDDLGTEPSTFTLVSGEVPPGLTLNSIGELSGTPQGLGSGGTSNPANLATDSFDGRGQTVADGTPLNGSNSIARIVGAGAGVTPAGFFVWDAPDRYNAAPNTEVIPQFDTAVKKSGSYSARFALQQVPSFPSSWGGSFFHYSLPSAAPALYFNFWWRMDAQMAAATGAEPNLLHVRADGYGGFQMGYLRLDSSRRLVWARSSDGARSGGGPVMQADTWYRVETSFVASSGAVNVKVYSEAGALLQDTSFTFPTSNIGFIEFGALWCNLAAFASRGHMWFDDVAFSTQPIGTGTTGGIEGGSYSFVYRITDANGLTDTATVSVNVNDGVPGGGGGGGGGNPGPGTGVCNTASITEGFNTGDFAEDAGFINVVGGPSGTSTDAVLVTPGVIRQTSPGEWIAFHSEPITSTSMFVEADVTVSQLGGLTVGVIGRFSGGAMGPYSWVRADLIADGQSRPRITTTVSNNQGGITHQAAAGAVSVSAGQTKKLRLEIRGNNYRLLVDGATILNVTDNQLGSGSAVGLYASTSNPDAYAIDNFRAGPCS